MEYYYRVANNAAESARNGSVVVTDRECYRFVKNEEEHDFYAILIDTEGQNKEYAKMAISFEEWASRK
jgi:hypothetical protein